MIHNESSIHPKLFSAEWWHIFIFHIFFNQIKRSFWLSIHRLPVSIINMWQQRELYPLVQQSYTHVSLYKIFLDSKKVTNFSDLQTLPVTSKKLFRRYATEEYVNNSLPSYGYQWSETSGSTGEPFKFPLNRGYYFFKKYHCGDIECVWYKIVGKPRNADPYVDRFLLWKGFSFRAISKKFRFADIRTVNRPRGAHFLHIPVSEIRENPLKAIKKLREFRPDVLSGRATTLIELSRRIQEYNESSFHIPFMTSVGEMTTLSQRKHLEAFFGGEVYERYGLEELGDIAIECNQHNGLHIHEESQIVEILGYEDSPLPPGVRGRIIITSLTNYSVPFIRYDTGDIGEIFSEKCYCGVSARRLKIYGRLGAFLELGRKRYQFPEFAAIVTEFSEMILRSQIAKISEDTLELRIIPTHLLSNADRQKIRDAFKKTLGVVPDIKIVSEIPIIESGKTQFLIDETTAPK